jgi:hypothetical protein
VAPSANTGMFYSAKSQSHSAWDTSLTGGNGSPVPADSSSIQEASLYEQVDARSPLTVQQVLRLCADVAAGLAFLHATPLDLARLPLAGRPSTGKHAMLEALKFEAGSPAAGSSTGAGLSAVLSSAAASSSKLARIVHRGEWQYGEGEQI